MRVITENQVCAELSPVEALALVRQAHLDLFDGHATNVVRSRARSGRFTLHSLSAASERLGYSSIKVYSSVGGMRSCHVHLYDIGTGEHLCAIEGTKLGQLRTSASAVLAAKALTGGALRDTVICGTGYQAEGLVSSIAANKLVSGTVTIIGRDAQKTLQRAEELSNSYQLPVIAGQNREEALGRAETLFTATTSNEPVVSRRELHSLRHISALGANSLIRRELDSRTVADATIRCVDDIDVARVEGGTILPLIESGHLSWGNFTSLGQILAGEKTLSGQDTYSVYFSHGLGIQDLYLAAEIWKRVQG